MERTEDRMNWDALTAVGTIAAAVVGIVGIWINVFEKTRRLSIRLEYVPCLMVYVVNKSLRTVMITKIVLSIMGLIFYVDMLEGLNEIRIQPGGIQIIQLNYKDVQQSHEKAQLGKICNPADKVTITIRDSFRRKYTVKTDMTIGMFEN